MKHQDEVYQDVKSGCPECQVSDTVQVPEVVRASREVLIQARQQHPTASNSSARRQEWLPGKKLTEPGAAKDQAQQVATCSARRHNRVKQPRNDKGKRWKTLNSIEKYQDESMWCKSSVLILVRVSLIEHEW